MNVRYLTEDALGHLNHNKKSSFIWKLMYKRVLSKIDKSLINVDSIKKVIFNLHRLNDIKLEDTIYNNVSIRNQAVWYMIEDIEYYFPLCISFSDGITKVDIVLIEGDIDIRTSSMKTHKDRLFDHNPVLVVSVLKNLENSFSSLQKYLNNYKK